MKHKNTPDVKYWDIKWSAADTFHCTPPLYALVCYSSYCKWHPLFMFSARMQVYASFQPVQMLETTQIGV